MRIVPTDVKYSIHFNTSSAVQLEGMKALISTYSPKGNFMKFSVYIFKSVYVCSFLAEIIVLRDCLVFVDEIQCFTDVSLNEPARTYRYNSFSLIE